MGLFVKGPMVSTSKWLTGKRGVRNTHTVCELWPRSFRIQKSRCAAVPEIVTIATPRKKVDAAIL
ncbi:hypothetical protein ACS0TY_022736 [Phlomoides rotata]